MKSMLKKLILRQVTVCVLVVILLVVGVLATMNMSTNLLPKINMPMLGITFVYPGASASTVEKDVTSVVEDTLRSVSGVTERQTMSYDNVLIVVLTFNYGTDIDAKKNEVKEMFDTVTLPEQCQEPIITAVDMNGSATATIAVYNDDQDMDELFNSAEQLQSKFLGIEGVASVNLVGAPSRQINVKAISGLELVSLLLMEALTQENSDIPLGTIMADGNVVSIRNASDATSILDIMNLPIKMKLGADTLSQLSSMKSAVREYATCTLQEFNDYISTTLDARTRMADMDGMTATELQEERDGLGAMKSLMQLLRDNTYTELNFMWRTVIAPIVNDQAFQDLTDEQLEEIANNRGISVELLKWARDGAKNGTLEQDWQKLEAFRKVIPYEDTNGDGKLTGDDITYEQFALLFRDGSSQASGSTEPEFEGLNFIHDTTCAIENCTSQHLTYEQTVDACQFADAVNLVAYDNIITSKTEQGDSYVITDEQYAQLFATVTADNTQVTLMSADVIHVIRADNYETQVVPALTSYKQKHVDSNGNAVYQNGEVYQEDADGNAINSKGYLIGMDGRLVDKDGNYIDNDGNKITLTDEQRLTYPYTYGEYIIFSDQELVQLYTDMNADIDFGITPTTDTVRFMRRTDFANSTVSGDNGTLLLALSSLGTVTEEISYDGYAQYNGKRAIVIQVYAGGQANTTDVVDNIKKQLNVEGLDANVVLLSDTAQFINDSIGNVLSSIIIGGVLAVLVIYVFVRKVGSSLVVSITMPLSVLVALLGLWAMGISLNIVSLGGLAVGIGMLVDNSIVVLESITKYRDKGHSVYDSCVGGTAEVGGSLVASTLTNICVFFPILFTQGLTREIFYDLVWAVLYSLVMSLIVAVTVIPTLYYLIYKRNSQMGAVAPQNANLWLDRENSEPRANTTAVVADSTNNDDKAISKREKRRQRLAEKQQARAQKATNRINKGEKIYGNILQRVLTKRALVCILALVLFAGSTVMVFITGMDFMPSVDMGEVEVNIAFDASTDLEQAQTTTLQFKEQIEQLYNNDELQHIAVTIGVQGLMATDISGKLSIKLNTAKVQTGDVAQRIRELAQEKGVDNVSVTEMDGIVATVTSGMSGMSVSIVGPNIDTLYEIAGKVETKLKGVEGIVSVNNNAKDRVHQYSFVVDKYKCAEKGVEYMAVIGLLRVALSKDVVTSLDISGQGTDIFVSVDQSAVSDIDSLLNLTVGMTADGAIKIVDVLRTNSQGEIFAQDGGVIESYEMSVINRINNDYVATLDVESYGYDTGTISTRIENAVNEILVDYPGYHYQQSGVAKYLAEAFDGLIVALIAAFFLLYGVLACQFESLIKPLVVIVSIPFSFTGGFLALVITGTTLNVVSFVGIIMLMGVIVNGAIVMIDKIDLLIKEGMTPQQAVIEGCKSRLRAILMTTLTTVLALVPLALGLGDGGELMQPMGIVVLGGLLLGTLVTLVLIPCFYCIVKRIKFPKKHKHDQNDQQDEQQEQQTNPTTATND